MSQPCLRSNPRLMHCAGATTAGVWREVGWPGTGPPHAGMEPPWGLTHTPRQGKCLCFPFSLITRDFTPTGAPEVTCVCCSQCPSASPRPGVKCSDESITRQRTVDGVQPKGLHNINTKSLFFPVSESELWLFYMPLLPYRITHL